VHTLRDRAEAGKLYGAAAGGFLYSRNFFELVSAVRKTDNR
jgi:hypothetical protein